MILTLQEMPSRIERVFQQLKPLKAGSVLGWFGKDSRPEIDFVTVDPVEAITSTVTLSQAALAPAMAPGPMTAPGPCPPVASECDFFFEGLKDQVPTFNVTGAPPDSPISPPVVTSVESSIVTVGAINTANANYICSSNPPPSDSQFYITGTKLQARTFNGNSPTLFMGQYVKLQFTSAQLVAYGMTMNLNEGQTDEQFPESRRCVVFRTA